MSHADILPARAGTKWMRRHAEVESFRGTVSSAHAMITDYLFRQERYGEGLRHLCPF
jgi:hypothetical protein